MHLSDLIPCTYSQTVSSSGSSGNAFTMPFWVNPLPNYLETSSEFPGFSLMMETQSPTGQVDYWISLKIPGTVGAAELPEDFRYRLFCLCVVAELPREGIQEAAESLKSMWEYYRVPFVPVQCRPSPTTQVVELGQSFVRPTLHLSEDE